MRRRPPISTRTDTLFPYTTLFRSSLRSSKEEGQSNFNNPGTVFVGAGADFDLSPEVRVSTNLNHLWFQNTATLQVLRSEGSIPKDNGWDLSLAGIWRPKELGRATCREGVDRDVSIQGAAVYLIKNTTTQTI